MAKAKYYISTTTMCDREWKTIWVNNKKSNYIANVHGDVKNVSTGKMKTKMITNKGYYTVSIWINNKNYILFVHRIIMCLFVPIPQEYIDMGLTQLDLEVNHKDGNKLNLDLSNLEWCTEKENLKHASDTNLVRKGKLHGIALSEEKVIEILECLESGDRSFKEVAKMTGVSRNVVSRIYHGKHWNNFLDNYDLTNSHTKSNRVSIETVHEICRMLQSGKYTQNEIKRKLHISSGTVNDIYRGRIFTYISKDYDFSNVPKCMNNYQKIVDICQNLQDGLSDGEVANKVNCSKSLVNMIKLRKIHTDISKDYVW